MNLWGPLYTKKSPMRKKQVCQIFFPPFHFPVLLSFSDIEVIDLVLFSVNRVALKFHGHQILVHLTTLVEGLKDKPVLFL